MKSTKELARELGLLRKRKHVNRLSASCSTVQTFKFLIVIDFESTCWENAKFKSQEIIEFPAVLLNTQTGEIESEFHHYVQPQEQPTLSCFCTQLTGITQDQVDNGIPINLCLRRFCHWLNKLSTEKGVICHGTVNESNQSINTTCVTWSDWDLGVCLQYECKRKQLLKPVQLNVWIDLRATYRRFYDRKPNGLNGALQDLGIEFQGREHSGVDDARNTAKLAYRMIRDGCVMNNTRKMKDHTRTMSLPTGILLPVRKTPPRKVKEKASSPDLPVCQRETTKIGPVDNRHDVGVSSSCVNRSFKNIDEPCHLTNGVIPMRRTPPRKAKEKSVIRNSNVQNSLSDSRVGIAEIVQMDVTNKGVKTSTADTNCDCEDVCLCQDLEQFLSECDNICIPSAPASTGTVKLSKVTTSHKRKISPSDKRESLALNSPARKIPRRISPRKFSAADIYVDKEVSNGNPKTLTSRTTSIGLKVLDTNRSNETLNLKKSDTECFKKPNAVCGMITPSTARTSTCVKPHVSERISLSRLSNTSSSVKVNRPSVSCPTTPAYGNTNSSGYNTGFQTPSFGSKSMPLSNSSASSMKMTPPLCKCGRRSKRRMVQSPGQNMGRFFFSCSVRKRVGSKEGCDFFKWEMSMTYNTPQSHGSAAIMKQFVTPLSRSVSTNNSTFSQKRSLGIKSNTSQTMCIR